MLDNFDIQALLEHNINYKKERFTNYMIKIIEHRKKLNKDNFNIFSTSLIILIQSLYILNGLFY